MRVPSSVGRRVAVGLATLMLGFGANAFVILATHQSAASASSPKVDTMAQPLPSGSVNPADTYQVAQLNGPGSVNHTDTRWDVYGADLGHMFLYNGQLVLTFGDTFGGPAAYPFFSVPHNDWRANSMALINRPPNTPPTGGLIFSSMITNASGAAKQLLSSQNNSYEAAVIPTYGVSVGSRMYLHYMSVHQWGTPGHWTLNYSGMAYSDDGGQHWVKSGTTWPGTSNFGQVAMVPQGSYVYLFGIPGGRYGALQLARVPATKMLSISAYQYWNGNSWVTGKPAAAMNLVPSPVGELSVQWNSYYKKWLMTYLVDPTGQVVLRMSDSLTGPWSAAQVIVDSSQYPQLYAPYITPLWNNGPDIYFNMSVYDHYQVYLMHTSLSALSAGTQSRIAASPPAGSLSTSPRPTYPYAHGRGSVRAP